MHESSTLNSSISFFLVSCHDRIPSLLMQAAQSAAQADGLATNKLVQVPEQDLRKQVVPTASTGGGKKKGPPLRRGKWTAEEEAYANRLIQEFKSGLLPLTDGTTLRTFLSKLLNCDPMRISKKFVGSNCIGKQVFRRRTADLNRLTPEQIQKSRAELSELERRFLDRVAQTNRVKSSGVGGGAAASTGVHLGDGLEGIKKEEVSNASPPSPPWLGKPLGYKQGAGRGVTRYVTSRGSVVKLSAPKAHILDCGPADSDSSIVEVDTRPTPSPLPRLTQTQTAARYGMPPSITQCRAQ